VKTFYALIAVLLLVPVATGQVGDGGYYSDDSGNVVTVDVTDTPSTDHSVTFTDATGFSSAVNGTPSANSTANHPTVDSSAQGTTTGGTTYQVKKVDGKVGVYKKVGKSWKKLKKVRKPKGSGGGIERLQTGDLAPFPGTLSDTYGRSLPMLAGDVAPFDGWLTSSPGDEVTSIPTGTNGFHAGGAP
jgi:hypothetical protein